MPLIEVTEGEVIVYVNRQAETLVKGVKIDLPEETVAQLEKHPAIKIKREKVKGEQ